MEIIFDGIAFGSLMFLISVGLVVTLGLMNFINLAHGVFGMIGGYLASSLVVDLNLPFGLSIVMAALGAGVAGFFLERLLFARLYGKPELHQVLLTLGLIFMAMAAARYLFGAAERSIRLPNGLTGTYTLGTLDLGRYHIFIIAIAACLAILLHRFIVSTRLGSQLRAAVDDVATARALGINVDLIFCFTFTLGCALAGLGGALGVELLGLSPAFPLSYLVYFLIVVVVGGQGNIFGAFFASLLLGLADVFGKYFIPVLGGFTIYMLMVLILVFKPHGLFSRQVGKL